jgi:TPR repeat protein
MNSIGFDYHHEKQQYDKALAWYLLAARENNSTAQNNIGTLYYNGTGVPENYLCALKWYLKAAERIDMLNNPINIGILFDDGCGVPLDKYKALEWFCHGGNKTHRERLEGEGYHLSASDMGTFNYSIASLY